MTVDPIPANTQEAEGFAAAFLRSYLTYDKGGPEPIRLFTELPDPRTANVGDGDKVTQRVVEIWPIKSDVLSGHHMNVRMIAIVERDRASADMEMREKSKRLIYRVDVPVTEGKEGKFQILQYPKFERVERSNSAVLPTSGQGNTEAAERMKPMLESFYKVYFEAEKSEDIANFFKRVQNAPKPQNKLFTFERLDRVDAFGKDKTWFVLVNLRVRDPFTTISYGASYYLEVEEQEGKFYIVSMNE